jgi:hypothetical protein
MGLTESTLKTRHINPLVKTDSSTPLPHFNLDAAKFTNDTVGFVITVTDIAKNITSSTYNIKACYALDGNSYMFICDDDTVLTFFKDINTKQVLCKVNRANTSTVIVRPCISRYETFGSNEIDCLSKLYTANCQN